MCCPHKGQDTDLSAANRQKMCPLGVTDKGEAPYISMDGAGMCPRVPANSSLLKPTWRSA